MAAIPSQRNAINPCQPLRLDSVLPLPETAQPCATLSSRISTPTSTPWRLSYLHRDSDAEPTLNILGDTIGFFGHTHRQNIFRLPTAAPPEEIAPGVFQLPEHTAFAVTVGSVGQPRDPGPEAAWTMWDPEARTITFRRVPYDHAAAAAAITAAGLPAGSAQRLLR